jgi:hypothetical protein
LRCAHEQPSHRSTDQLEDRNAKQQRDEESAQRLELGVSVGMVFIRLLRCQSDDRDAEDVIHGIDGRLQGVTKYSQGIGVEPDRELYDHDDDVCDEDAAQDAAHPRRSFPRGSYAGHGGSWEVESRKSRVQATLVNLLQAAVVLLQRGPQDRRLQISRLRNRQNLRMIGPLTQNSLDDETAATVTGRLRQHSQKHREANVKGT